MIAAPPVLAGAFQLATAVSAPPAGPCAGARIAGASGTVAGVTVLDWAEKAPAPIAFTARTRKV